MLGGTMCQDNGQPEYTLNASRTECDTSHVLNGAPDAKMFRVSIPDSLAERKEKSKVTQLVPTILNNGIHV